MTMDPISHDAPLSVKGADDSVTAAEVERLWVFTDNMFHQRVMYMILLQTVFFLAASQVWGSKLAVIIFCVTGMLSMSVFTLTNLKLYWRHRGIRERYLRNSEVFRAYLGGHDIDHKKCSWVTNWMMGYLIKKRDVPIRGILAIFRDTGWLYSWGMWLLLTATWISLLSARLAQ